MTPTVLVHLYCYCPDHKARTAVEIEAGHDVTHGICPACLAKLMAELDKAAK